MGVELVDAYSVGPVPNGGYQVALSCRAALATLGVPDVLSVSSYFLAPALCGPGELHVEPVKRGRSTALASVRLVQEGRERIRSLVLAGDLSAHRGPELHRTEPPELPPPERCLHMTPSQGAPRLMGEVELRLEPAAAAFLRGEKGADPELRGWMRFADGRPTDALALTFFADVLPPTTFNTYGMTGWVPTLELTTQLRRRPAPGWIRIRMSTRHVSAGHLEEDGELWDEAGQLVAISRQRAVMLPGGPSGG